MDHYSSCGIFIISELFFTYSFAAAGWKQAVILSKKNNTILSENVLISFGSARLQAVENDSMQNILKLFVQQIEIMNGIQNKIAQILDSKPGSLKLSKFSSSSHLNLI